MNKCMYCAEMGIDKEGTIEILDIELGPGYICKECNDEYNKEMNEYVHELEEKSEVYDALYYFMKDHGGDRFDLEALSANDCFDLVGQLTDIVLKK